MAALSFIWLILRTGRKPSRVVYPCQKAAIGNINLFLLALSVLFLHSSKNIQKLSWSLKRRRIKSFLLLNSLILCACTFVAFDLRYVQSSEPSSSQFVPIDLKPQEALSPVNSSELFFVQNAYGADGSMDMALSTLLNLMEANGLFFYNTSIQLNGLICRDDVVIIKVNCQWPERGGTNTDLVKSIISKILNHPEGFDGEIVVADSGQGLGSLDWNNSNAFGNFQSMQDVVDNFSSHKVSTFLWDSIRTETSEYNEGNFEDGYVFDSTVDSTVYIYPSYPKFKTRYGTCVSFKEGVWNNVASSYDSKKLKVINVPVLKSHVNYGVTGCVKHYMGIPFQQGAIYRNVHVQIRLGAMGTLMAKTRFPVLNILDAIWINANPLESGDDRGPQTSYEAACFTNILGASLDPVALDYYSSKHILIPAAIHCNHTIYSSLDPDYVPTSSGPTWPPMITSFHNYLERSMNVLKENDHQVTMNESEMTVQVAFAGPIYNMNTGLHHETIQEAVNHARDGDTIFARNGTHYENVLVNRTVSLIGENSESTIIDGNGVSNVISIIRENVTIAGFTITNSGSVPYNAGIYLDNASHSILNGNTIMKNNYGIMVFALCNNITIINNNIRNNDFGIRLFSNSHHGKISNNYIGNHSKGYGIGTTSSNYTKIYHNIVLNNYAGLLIGGRTTGSSSHNSIFQNIIGGSIVYGIEICGQYSQNNTFYHNDLVNNSIHVIISPEVSYPNFWDRSYPLGGNYWESHNDSDFFNGPYQNDSGSDGIGDSPYFIDDFNIDRYPLVEPSNLIVWDVDIDGLIGFDDIALVVGHFGSSPGYSRWNAVFDINKDSYVGIDDVVNVAEHYGESIWY